MSFNFMVALTMAAVILEPKKIKSVIVSLSICHEVIRQDAMISFFDVEF